MRRFITLLFAVVIVLPHTLWSNIAAATTHNICGRAAFIHEQLTKRYGETIWFDAVTSSGGLLEVYINMETGQWTIVVSNTRMYTCLITTGDGWRGPLATQEERVN